ncbi:hypothetical protein ACIOHS_42015 [Streptomyces sp. NPDC088253]|uniref:hypothetical protein n=1 Tax=Streptomyces sp. NPDC088253 TaxID=3365846 RepID=UPI0037F2A3AA
MALAGCPAAVDCADRRAANGQRTLFTSDARFLVFMDATAPEPTRAPHGRDSPPPSSTP